MSIAIKCSECHEVCRYTLAEIIGKETVFYRSLSTKETGHAVIRCKTCGENFKIDKKKIPKILEG